MLKLTTETLELRGIEGKKSSKGNLYYSIYVENAQGKPHQFYAKDSKGFPQDLKKGDLIVATLLLNNFGNLEVEKIDKVGE